MSAAQQLVERVASGARTVTRRLLGSVRRSPPANAAAVPLLPEEALELRLPWGSRLTSEGLADLARANPGLVWRLPDSNEFAVGGWWQGRTDIGLLVEAPATGRDILVDAVTSALRAAGARLVMLSPEEEERASDYYRRRRWETIEEVLVYRRPALPVPACSNSLRYQALTDATLPALLALEDAAFPWLWRYGARFFWEAADSDDRVLRLAWDDRGLAGYFIITLHHGFGHVDRLAIDPSRQGNGLGGALLSCALAELWARGGRITGLSTQHDNRRSQRLYESFGFRRTGRYEVHGKWLQDHGMAQA